MDLRTKYDQAIQIAKRLRMEGSAEERSDKLYVNGTVASEDVKNQIWTALKSVSDYASEVVADIRVVAPTGESAAAAASGSADTSAVKTYTVRVGDTLSAIAKTHLGSDNAYTRIFEANRDVLSHPDKIRPGQVLIIPGTHGSGPGIDD